MLPEREANSFSVSMQGLISRILAFSLKPEIPKRHNRSPFSQSFGLAFSGPFRSSGLWAATGNPYAERKEGQQHIHLPTLETPPLLRNIWQTDGPPRISPRNTHSRARAHRSNPQPGALQILQTSAPVGGARCTTTPIIPCWLGLMGVLVQNIWKGKGWFTVLKRLKGHPVVFTDLPIFTQQITIELHGNCRDLWPNMGLEPTTLRLSVPCCN